MWNWSFGLSSLLTQLKELKLYCFITFSFIDFCFWMLKMNKLKLEFCCRKSWSVWKPSSTRSWTWTRRRFNVTPKKEMKRWRHHHSGQFHQILCRAQKCDAEIIWSENAVPFQSKIATLQFNNELQLKVMHHLPNLCPFVRCHSPKSFLFCRSWCYWPLYTKPTFSD